MEREQHLAMLRKLIQQNEKSLAELKTLVSELEECRQESVDRHASTNRKNEQRKSPRGVSL